MTRSVLRAEIAEQPDVLARLLVREGPNVRRIARALRRHDLRVVLLDAGTERSVAATKSYTAQLLAVALLASALSPSRRYAEGLGALPDAVAETLGVEPAARRAAARLAEAARLVVLSRGLNYPTAHEIALKLKELALLEAEALSGADFRHGPIALAGPRLPAVVVSPPGTATEADLGELAAELARRGSPVLLIGPSGRGSLPVPRLPELLSPIAAVVPGQLLAFHAARARGLDPDAPRGLTKVTETR